MPMTLDEIVEQTRQLPPDVVGELVERIMLSLHGGADPEVEAAWNSEMHRRIDEIKTGTVQGIPVEESLARARRIAGL